jgi:hypothetical protein
MSMREVFRILYAPHKAFKEIIQKPGYKGPLIIMLLFVLSFSGFYYVFFARVFYDQTDPPLSDKDKWTEDLSFWFSNASKSLNTVDYISCSYYYGDKSIQFNFKNASKIYMELKIPESLNCIEPNNYTKLSFRMKIVEPLEKPTNISIYLFSENTTNKFFFHSMLDDDIEIGGWNNITLPLHSFDGNGNWRNITSLKFEITWTNNKNITVLIDGIFFYGDVYKSVLEMSGSAIMIYYLISGFMQFTIQWVILGVILYLFLKLFRAQPVWKTILTISGYVLITFFMQNLILTGVVLAYPEMHLSLGWTADWQNYISIIIIQWYVLDRIIYYIWIVALCSIAVHLLFEFPWTRSVSISFLSSVISMLAFRFLIYGAVWL